jgi:hypothetical protein
VFDGFVGSSYAKLITDQPNTQTNSVCFRVDQGTTFEPGGRLDVPVSASAPAITTDTSYNACSTTPGNTIPGSHPMFSTSGPPLGTDMIDSYADGNGNAWLCLEADPAVGSRVKINQGSAGGPPTLNQDSPPVGAPSPAPGPTGQPSTTCQNGSNPDPVQAIDANIAGTQVWLYGWKESPTKIDLCLRAQNTSQNAGGKITIDATGAPGVTPVGPSAGSDNSACTQTVRTISAEGVTVTLSTTPMGANPAAVCVTSPSLPQPVVISGGFTGSPAAGHSSWTPDTGTPIPPIGT